MNMQPNDKPHKGGSRQQTLIDPPEFEAVSKAVEAVIVSPVLAVTRIEGGPVASLRVRFEGGSLIATLRDTQSDLKREARMLRKLWKAGASVPQFFASSDGFLIEEDPGGRCLTAAFATADADLRLRMMEAAFVGLYSIKEIARRAKLVEPPPLFRSDPGWLERFASSPLFLADSLGIAPPSIDYNAVIKFLKMPAAHFVKWGASPCNAHIGDDGCVTWFDWHTAGFGAGYEDIGFLISDENWPLEPATGLALYRRFQPDWNPQTEAQLCLFAALRACHRLLSIRSEHPEEVTMDSIRRLAAHGLAFAGRTRLMRGAEPWFEVLASEEIWCDTLARQLGASGARPETHAS